MSSNEYIITYAADVSSALAGVGQLKAELLALEPDIDRIGKKIRDMAKGVATPLNAATKSVAGLGNALGTLGTQAGAAAGAVTGVGTAATGAATGVSAAGAATTSLGSRFRAAGSNAATMATNLSGVTAAANGAAPALTAAGAAAGGMTDPTRGASDAVGGFTGRLIAMQAARAAFRALMDESQKLEEYWQKLAKESTDFRESLRELANVKGEAGPNNNVTADVLDTALRTRMTTDKAKKLTQSWANYSQAIEGKGHLAPADGDTKKLESEIVGEAGKTARRVGLEEGAAGDALGAVGLFHRITSKEDSQEQLAGAIKGLSRGSVEYTPGINALNKSAAKLVDPKDEDLKEMKAEGAVPGRVGSYAEAGTYLGALSLGTGKRADLAGQRMVQISRLLNPEAANETANKALKTAGVTQEMDDPDKFIRLNKYLKAQRLDPTKFLENNKLGSVATREATVAGMKQADVLETWIKEVRESKKKNVTGKQSIAENERFMASDKSATAAGVDSLTDVMNKTEGIEGSEEFEKAKKYAEQRIRLKDPDWQKSYTRGIVNATIGNVVGYLGFGASGEGVEQETHTKYGAIPTLRSAGQDVGVDVMKEYPGLQSGDIRERGKAFTAAAAAVTSKGGDPYGSKDLTEEALRRVNATRSPAAPAAVPPGAAPGRPLAAIPGLPVVPAAVPIPAGFPALRPAAPLTPAVPGAASPFGPTASTLGVKPDPGTMRVQNDMLKALNKLVDYTKPRPFAGGVASVGSFGPLGVDGGDFGERRA